jgi:RNA polymerase sigma factor (sigma-70 family)
MEREQATNAEVALAQRILGGDRSAEDELVKAYGRGVFAIAAARTHDREAARDLTQETLVAVIKALREGQLRDVCKLGAFIQGTARNIINNYQRRQARRSECELVSADVPGVDPVEERESAERQLLVRQALQAFSVTDQQILLLSLVDGHSLDEVARRLNMSYDAVRARKSRMLRKIKKRFAHVSQR